MKELPHIERVVSLLGEALQRLAARGSDYIPAAADALEKAMHALTMPAPDRRQYPLLLASVRRRVASAEALVVARLIGEEDYSGDEASVLVRLRLICREVLNLLQRTLSGLQPAPRAL